MTRLLGLAFLLGALQAGAQANPLAGSRKPPPSSSQAKLVAILEKEREALEALRPQIESLLGDLLSLRRGYEASWMPARRSLDRREPLRRELERKFEEVRGHVETFRGHLNEYENLSFANAFIQFSIDGRGAEKIAEKVASDGPARKYSHGLDPLIRGVRQALEEEQTAFDAALARRRRRLLGSWAGALLSALALPLLLIKLRSLARKAPPAPSGGEMLIFANRYRLDRELGKNPLGTLHAGIDIENGSVVRVWVLDPSCGASPSRVRSIAQGARAAAALKGPSFPRVLAVLHEGSRLGLILEPPRGRPVREILGAGTRASFASTLGLLEQAAAALEALHSIGLSHGALCPANLFLSPEGSLQIGALALPCGGDPAYQAPEHPCAACPSDQLLPSEAHDRLPGIGSSCAGDRASAQTGRAGDVYGLAACAYALLTGRTPFPGPDIVEQKRLLALPSLPAPQRLPARLEAVLRKGLCPDPALRFPFCREFMAALRSASKPPGRDPRGR